VGAGNYDINAEQGSNFSLYVQYQTGTGASIDLAVYNDVRMQVRRSKSSTKKLIELNKDGVTGGGVTGDFTSVPVGSTNGGTYGVGGSGGIKLNTGTAGGTGTYGFVTGGIFLEISSYTMKDVPTGNHVYDIELLQGTAGTTASNVTRILQGRFNIDGEVTK